MAKLTGEYNEVRTGTSEKARGCPLTTARGCDGESRATYGHERMAEGKHWNQGRGKKQADSATHVEISPRCGASWL